MTDPTLTQMANAYAKRRAARNSKCSRPGAKAKFGNYFATQTAAFLRDADIVVRQANTQRMWLQDHAAELKDARDSLRKIADPTDQKVRDTVIALHNKIGKLLTQIRDEIPHRFSRPGTKSTHAVKVGDRVHAGLATAGGAGVVGIVTKIEDDYAHIRADDSPSDKYGPKTYKAPMRLVTKASRPGTKTECVRIDENSIRRWESQMGKKITSAGRGTWAFIDPYGKTVLVPIVGTFKEAVAWLNKNAEHKDLNDAFKVGMSRPGAKAESTHAQLPDQTLEAARQPGGGAHSEAVSRKIKKLIDEGLNLIESFEQLEQTVSELSKRLDDSVKDYSLLEADYARLKELLKEREDRVRVLLQRSKSLLELSQNLKAQSELWRTTTIVFSVTTIVCGGLLAWHLFNP